MTQGQSDRETRAAENEDLFRRLNERLHVLANVAASAVEAEASEMPERFLCECAQVRCSQVIELTPHQYQRVRETNRRFLVAPDVSHTSPDLEVVVERHESYWVVEKVGEAGAEADALADRNSDPL
jgi:hypothetical protein